MYIHVTVTVIATYACMCMYIATHKNVVVGTNTVIVLMAKYRSHLRYM